MPEPSESFTILQSVDSTNNYAMAHVHAGMAKHGKIYFSHAQTAGKGQRGKHWNTGNGENIAMSMVVQPDLVGIGNQFSLSMGVALACCTLIDGNSNLHPLIKWPNDIYLGDRKAGGILIENVRKGEAWPFSVVGIGLNINQTVFDAALPNPVSLKILTGVHYDVVALARELGQCIVRELEWLKTSGSAALLQRYNERLFKRSEEVMLKKGAVNFKAQILGVTGQGRLATRHAIEQEFDWGEVEWRPTH